MKEAVITSSVLILCITLLRRLCRERLSAELQYVLWLIVALRLVMPGITAIFPDLLPESEFSIMNVADKVETAAQDYIAPQQQLGQVDFTIGGLPYLTETANGASASMFSQEMIWTDLLRGIWYLGMVIVGIWMITVNLCFMRRLHKNCTKYEREGYKLPVYLVKGLSSPCLYGLPGRQAVYLPEYVAEDTQRVRHILAHEYCHYKHQDAIWSVLRCILVAVYWFHPLVWLAAFLSKQDCELACDEAAIKLLGEEERIAYGKTLLSLIVRKNKPSDIVCTATTMTAGAEGIKERIRRIAEKPRRLAAVLFLVLLVVGAVAVFTFTQAKAYPEGAYLLEGEKTLTVTTSCFQVTFPDAFAEKAYYIRDKDTDIIVCHRKSDREIGRFCAMPYEEAMQLADEREVVLIGNYGSNSALKNYIDGETTVHEYESNASEKENVKNTADGVPGTDSNSETTYIFEDAYVLEEDRSTSAAEESIGGGAQPLPAPEEVEYEAITLPYKEGQDDTAITVTEEEHDYLPNEQITEIHLASEEPCYLYIPADNTDADQSIRSELLEMNRALIELTDSVTVLYMSMESMQGILDILIENRTSDVSDTSRTSVIADALPAVQGLQYQFLEMDTASEPYAVTLHYYLEADDPEQISSDTQFMAAVLMFASIENLKQCNLQIRTMDTKDSAALGESGYIEISYEREQLEQLFGSLYPCSETREDFVDLYNRVLEYLEI